MFINLSNHPSRYWGDRQREAASSYGDVIDISFPAIAPNASNDKLQVLAQACVERIASLDEIENITVHVMGEMTFTYMVVAKLKELGIKCVASTTERKTTYASDGTKLSEFSFVKFREY